MARDMILRLVFLGLSVLAGLPIAGRGEETLPDPTRPPAAILGPQSEAGGVPLGGPVLQAIRISQEHKSAIISGERVALGGKFGDARLVRLTSSEAVLDGPEGKTVLRLVPGVEKKPVVGAAIKRAGNKRTDAAERVPHH